MHPSGKLHAPAALGPIKGQRGFGERVERGRGLGLYSPQDHIKDLGVPHTPMVGPRENLWNLQLVYQWPLGMPKACLALTPALPQGIVSSCVFGSAPFHFFIFVWFLLIFFFASASW